MKIPTSDIGVTHVTSPTPLKITLFEYIKKNYKKLLSAVAIPLFIGLALATGKPLWWDYLANLLSYSYSYSYSWIVCGGLIITIIVINHKNHHKSLQLRSNLHNYAHCSRDAISNLIERTHKQSYNYEIEQHNMLAISNKLSELIKNYYVELLNDKTITCAIRLGVEYTDHNNHIDIEYVTFGRSSSNYNDEGSKNLSEALKRNKGIPRFFEQKGIGRMGALYYDNIPLAIEKKVYVKTNNQGYKKHIKSMIVTPINGWNGEENDFIGLLHISSEKTTLLDDKFVNIVKFHGDSLASTYTSMFSRFKAKATNEKIINEIKA